MKHYPSHHGLSRGAVIALSLSAFGFAGLLATAAPAATATFTGLVDAQTNPYGYHRVEVSHAGMLHATLTWSTVSASLALMLARKNPDGTWQRVTSVRGSQPLSLSYPVTAGSWRIGPKALTGASRYSTTVDYPTGVPAEKAYVTLLFSRSAITAADACAADSTNVVPLDTGVAPELARRGLVGTGTVQTGLTQEHTRACTHGRKTLVASWDDLATLRDQWGWSFVSHSRTYPQNWDTMTQRQQWDESCGTILDLLAHGHTRADGLFAYPHNQWTVEAQTNVISTCFAFGRRYAGGATTRAAVTTPPYWANTQQVGGGNCNVAGAMCSGVSDLPYRSPVKLAGQMAALKPGQWLDLQAYVLVKGTRAGLWDCTSSDWHFHWTNDWERYCWNDYLRILDAIPQGAVTTDPKTIAQAWGRTNYTPQPS